MQIKGFDRRVFIGLLALGLGMIGYLGCRALRWLTVRSPRTETIDRVSREAISSQNKIDKDKITQGQGEYVIFLQYPNGERREVSKECYGKVYLILKQYSPISLSKAGRFSEGANRYQLMVSQLKEIDPHLEAVFIPRTLYELFFIRKCIREDLKHQEICPLLDRWTQLYIHFPEQIQLISESPEEREEGLKKILAVQVKRKCWHLHYVDDAGQQEPSGIKDIAYRLNQTIFKKLSPPKEGFTSAELALHAENKIQFLKDLHAKGVVELDKIKQKQSIKVIADCNRAGPTTNFGYELDRASSKPMGIRHEGDAQIIRNAVALECSTVAQQAVLLYRGSNFSQDSAASQKGDYPYSLSYGTSLFAGCLYDAGATAFHYMRNEKNAAYAIAIPFDKLDLSPFYIPPIHTVALQYGHGEIFHARTKAWKGVNLLDIAGFAVSSKSFQREHLESQLSKEELLSEFQNYKNKAIYLK